jgi:antitoxin component HigA of HigAB toxin-antitoxin module
MQLNDQDRYEWAHHPVTQEFMKKLQDSLEEAKDAWAAEQFVAATPELSMQYNATALGGVRVLKELLDQFETMKLFQGGIGE